MEPPSSITIHFGKNPDGSDRKNESVTVDADGTVIVQGTSPGTIQSPPLTREEICDILAFMKFFQETFAQSNPKELTGTSNLLTEEAGQRILDGCTRRMLELMARLSTLAPDSYPTSERLAAWMEKFFGRELNRPVLPNP